MNDFMKFDKFVTPVIIQIIWWLGNLGLIVGLGAGMSDKYTHKGMLLLAVIAGFVIWRVYCELLILLFKIYDRLGESNRHV